jgi:hypothetical protein
MSHIVKVDIDWLAKQVVETGKSPADIIVAEYERLLNAAFDEMARAHESVLRRSAES